MKFSQTPEHKATVSHPHRIQEESVKSYFLSKRLSFRRHTYKTVKTA